MLSFRTTPSPLLLCSVTFILNVTFCPFSNLISFTLYHVSFLYVYVLIVALCIPFHLHSNICLGSIYCRNRLKQYGDSVCYY